MASLTAFPLGRLYWRDPLRAPSETPEDRLHIRDIVARPRIPLVSFPIRHCHRELLLESSGQDVPPSRSSSQRHFVERKILTINALQALDSRSFDYGCSGDGRGIRWCMRLKNGLDGATMPANVTKE